MGVWFEKPDSFGLFLLFLKFRAREAERFSSTTAAWSRGHSTSLLLLSFFFSQVRGHQLTDPTQTNSVSFTAADLGLEVLKIIFMVYFIPFRCHIDRLAEGPEKPQNSIYTLHKTIYKLIWSTSAL